eukprot:gene5592-18061_t
MGGVGAPGGQLPNIFNSIPALEFAGLDATPDPSAELRRERGVALPPWLPAVLEARIKAADDDACARMVEQQHAAVRSSAGAPAGDSEPSAEQYQRWMQREHQKLKLSTVDAPPAACLEGEWAYGRHVHTGVISSYAIQRNPGGGYDYVEMKQAGGELRGALVDAAS